MATSKNYVLGLINVAITFGIACLYQHCSDKNNIWEGLINYCGDNHSPIEDYYYRNTLATLIKEDLLYENKYIKNPDGYYISIGKYDTPYKL